MSRFLIVTWDGAGNLVPTMTVAARLARAGHDVRLLGHRAIERRCGNHGWRFRPFVRTIEIDSAAAMGGNAGMLHLARDLWCHPSVAEDVRIELAREPADVLVGDCMLLGALTAGQAARIPTVAVFHGALAPFRHGPFVDLVSPFLAQVNASSVAAVHDRCALSVVAAPREFEPPVPIPANVRFAGPLLDGPPLLPVEGDRRLPAGMDRPVLVSLSTSDQGQTPVLRRIVDALSRLRVAAIVTTGPAIDPAALPRAGNVTVVRFIPHASVLPRASLVLTHAGLGTVMASLAHGVPMLCLPFGRDQFFNASRVEAIGAGRTVAAEADAGTLASAIADLLADGNARAAARRFAEVISGYRAGVDALSALERVAHVECGA